MIKINIYQKAKRLQKYIRWNGTTELTDFFELEFKKEDNEKNILVHLNKQPGLGFSCTCKWHSVKNIHMDKLCSFVLACIYFRMKK